MRKRPHVTVLGATAFALAATALAPTTTASAAPDDGVQAAALTGRLVTVAIAPGPSSQLITMLPDGSDRQRIHEFPSDAAFFGLDVTDDGSSIALSRWTGTTRSYNIFTVNSDGSDHQRITSGKGQFTQPTFSPNGGKIAFSDFSLDSLLRMKADGSSVTMLTNGAEPLGYSPSWSPDGEHIAFISSTRTTISIVLTDPKGTWFRFVKTFQRDRTIRILGLDWSPDSSEIVYSRYAENSSVDLWTVSKNGSTVTQITDTPTLDELFPRYSPDGSAIAALVSPPKERWADIVVMDADGSNRDRIDTPKIEEEYVAWGETP